MPLCFLFSLLGVLVVGHGGGGGRLLAATADGTVGEVDAEQRDDLELLGGTENGVSSNGQSFRENRKSFSLRRAFSDRQREVAVRD